VKRTLFTPLLLILNTAAFALLLFVPSFIASEGALILPPNVGAFLLGAILASLFVTVLRSLFKPIVPVLFLLLVIGTVVGLVLGTIVLDTRFLSEDVADPVFRDRIPTDTILQGESVSFWVGERNGVELRDLVVFRTGEIPTIRRVESATWNPSADEIYLANGDPIKTAETEGIFRWELPESIERTVGDVERVYRQLARAYRSRSIVVILVWIGTFVLAAAFLWTPARLFRWPLLNAITAFAYVRAVIAIPAFLHTYSPIESTPFTVPELVIRFQVPIAWAIAATLLLVVAVVLPSLSHWRREFSREV
jgi:hypothetical protein